MIQSVMNSLMMMNDISFVCVDLMYIYELVEAEALW